MRRVLGGFNQILRVPQIGVRYALVLKKYIKSITKVLIKYYKHLKLFLWKEANKLLKRQPYDYKIIIKKGKYFKFRPLYKIF